MEVGWQGDDALNTALVQANMTCPHEDSTHGGTPESHADTRVQTKAKK